MTIDVRYHIRRGDFKLKVEFSIPARGVTAIFGPSGSGKTLTLRAMAGLERESAGLMRVGRDIWQEGDTFVPTHERGVGYVFQEASLFPHLSIRGNLEYALRRVPKDVEGLGLTEAASLLGVSGILDRRPEGLSGGERQRVAIARALLTRPRILLMDEPLTSLDQAGKSDILPFLDRLHRELEIPLIYVSHATEEVAQLADHMVLFEKGTVLASGPIQEMLTRLDLPLALAPEAESVVDAVVTDHDEQHGLTFLDFAGGRISVPNTGLAKGKTVRVRLRARDISLTLEHHSDTSILNIFPATVEVLSENDGPQVTVRLNVGGVPILSRITRRSMSQLNVTPGTQVFIQVKSVALLA